MTLLTLWHTQLDPVQLFSFVTYPEAAGLGIWMRLLDPVRARDLHLQAMDEEKEVCLGSSRRSLATPRARLPITHSIDQFMEPFGTAATVPLFYAELLAFHQPGSSQWKLVMVPFAPSIPINGPFNGPDVFSHLHSSLVPHMPVLPPSFGPFHPFVIFDVSSRSAQRRRQSDSEQTCNSSRAKENVYNPRHKPMDRKALNLRFPDSSGPSGVIMGLPRRSTCISHTDLENSLAHFFRIIRRWLDAFLEISEDRWSKLGMLRVACQRRLSQMSTVNEISLMPDDSTLSSARESGPITQPDTEETSNLTFLWCGDGWTHGT
ncbi:hypothetical protein EDB85DRAFT_1891290 [Lactarius pseudohatsudake]|nr:hypothetical protein EDB85DRAFT_1891290 [Lactarius pseudohatsudake]